ncbi:DNA-binding transcriptional regulator, MerR family [Thermomonospora echinospora]|uniref:DNA-binding transcriptional regulator, MerR family n=1 Tax=Thermomonospora echinospora TaxID=1992 RepID=A0A1H6D885_9ACTN|nr:MerR family transcriptional regulator [Thermomonospora echinospora]SEG81308.1 DNA-binding transcriptional regulator, MerR family [Thermomonospora echinospora]
MLIGELSRRTGVSPRLLRYYEEQGLLAAGRGPNGYRHYDDDSVITVRKIRVLLDAGLSTEVIRSVLPCTRDDQPEFDWCADIRDLLDRELAALDARIKSLQRDRGTLAGFLAQPGGHPQIE